MASIVLMGAALGLLVGCPPAPVPPPPAPFAAGEALVVAQATALVSRQPMTDRGVDLLEAYRGKAGRVLAPGTAVVMLAAEDPAASSTAAVDPAAGASWLPVRVEAAAFPAHVGVTGWVFVEALAKAPPGYTGATEAAARAGARAELLDAPSWLCAWPEGPFAEGPQCPVEVHPSLPLHVLGCEPSAVRVALWDPSGVYINGFIPKSAFVDAQAACAAPAP